MSGLVPEAQAHAQTQEQDEERRHFQRITNSFAQHSSFHLSTLSSHAARLKRLSPEQQALLPASLRPGSTEHKARISQSMAAVDKNQHFFDSLLQHAQQATSQDHFYYRQQLKDKYVWESDEDLDKVRSVLKSAVRDWSVEGAKEREQCYAPVIDGLKSHCAAKGRIFVGGAGLGRLALELVGAGFAVQGNDVSYHMLLASDFILNCCGGEQGSYEVAPFVSSTTNQLSPADVSRLVTIPDVDPYALMLGDDPSSPPDFSMAAGEFYECYSKPEERGQWDGVASCFFLDTASFVGDYVTCIWNMLKPGGVLVNLGPLLWHWSGGTIGTRPDEDSAALYRRNVDPRYADSIDMTWQDLREILIHVGFEIIDERTGLECTYTRDTRALMHTQYTCVYFVAKKPASAV
jgi:carnosine N-methyltransferase